MMKIIGIILFWLHIGWHILLVWLIGDSIVNHSVEIAIALALIGVYLIYRHRKVADGIVDELKQQIEEEVE